MGPVRGDAGDCGDGGGNDDGDGDDDDDGDGDADPRGAGSRVGRNTILPRLRWRRRRRRRRRRQCGSHMLRRAGGGVPPAGRGVPHRGRGGPGRPGGVVMLSLEVVDGTMAVVVGLAAALPDGAVWLGRKVERIGWRPGGGGVGEGVRVWFVDREIEEADRGFVTMSLGVLKASNVAFGPRLPATKLGVIMRLGFGLVTLLLLR